MRKSLWVIGAAAALIFVLLIAAVLLVPWGLGGNHGWGMMGPGMMGGWSGLSIVGPICTLTLMGLIIGGAVWFMRTQWSSDSQTWSGRSAMESPLEILRRRYAQGEITKEEFEDMKHDLDS